MLTMNALRRIWSKVEADTSFLETDFEVIQDRQSKGNNRYELLIRLRAYPNFEFRCGYELPAAHSFSVKYKPATVGYEWWSAITGWDNVVNSCIDWVRAAEVEISALPIQRKLAELEQWIEEQFADSSGTGDERFTREEIELLNKRIDALEKDVKDMRRRSAVSTDDDADDDDTQVAQDFEFMRMTLESATRRGWAAVVWGRLRKYLAKPETWAKANTLIKAVEVGTRLLPGPKGD